MTRNTIRRVEVAAPVHDRDLKLQLREMFITMLSDNQQARQMLSDGNYIRIQETDTPLNSREYFYQQAYDRNTGNQEGVVK